MPRWLADSNVRDGIRAMLKKDGCLWECRHLGREADNLCRWLGTELTAVKLAICMKNCELFIYYILYMLRCIPPDCSLHVLLAEHRHQLLFLQKRWLTPLASDVRFHTTVQEATRTTQLILGEDPALVLD